MTERQQITVKAKCKGVIRLLKIPTDVSYQAFHDLVGVEIYVVFVAFWIINKGLSIFLKLKNSFGVSNCHLQYSDEEGDTVGFVFLWKLIHTNIKFIYFAA